jgi:hypothetical protein
MGLTDRRHTLFLLSQHQVGALVATSVDYGVMILCVSLVGATPVLGTIIGSIAGAFVSFTLGRRWIFDAERGSFVSQAWRYALVSGVELVRQRARRVAAGARASALSGRACGGVTGGGRGVELSHASSLRVPERLGARRCRRCRGRSRG